MKRALVFLLACVLALGLLPLPALGASMKYGDYQYILVEGGNASIQKYRGSAAELTVPSKLDGHPVTEISPEAFKDCKSLVAVTLPGSVASIGNGAFSGCTSLTSLTLPEGLTNIGYLAFDRCTGLSSLTLPEGLTNIGAGAFCRCAGLVSLTLPDSLTSIGERAFDGCTGLSSLTLPEGLTSIGERAFDKGGSLVLHVAEDSYAHRYAVTAGLQVSATQTSAEKAFGEYAQGKLNVEGLFTLLNLCGDIAGEGFGKGLALLGQGEKAAEFSRFAGLLSDCDSVQAKVSGLTSYLAAHSIGTQEDRLCAMAQRFFSAGVSPALMEKVRGLGLREPLDYAPALWTREALEKFFGSKDVSPSHSQPDTCLVILDAESQVNDGYWFRPVSGDGGDYDVKAGDILRALSTASGGKLKFTGNPHLASVRISIRITYLKEGTYHILGDSRSIPGYRCSLALQAYGAVSGKTIATAYFHESLGDSITVYSVVWYKAASLPIVDGSSAEVKTFVEKILAH